MNNPITTLSRTELNGLASGLYKPADATVTMAQLASALLAVMDAKPVAVNDEMAFSFHRSISDSAIGLDEVEEIKDGLRAALSNVTTTPAPSAPDGWKLVPVEPTIAMTEAAIDEFNESRNMRDTYYALLEHAPAPVAIT